MTVRKPVADCPGTWVAIEARGLQRAPSTGSWSADFLAFLDRANGMIAEPVQPGAHLAMTDLKDGVLLVGRLTRSACLTAWTLEEGIEDIETRIGKHGRYEEKVTVRVTRLDPEAMYREHPCDPWFHGFEARLSDGAAAMDAGFQACVSKHGARLGSASSLNIEGGRFRARIGPPHSRHCRSRRDLLAERARLAACPGVAEVTATEVSINALNAGRYLGLL